MFKLFAFQVVAFAEDGYCAVSNPAGRVERYVRVGGQTGRNGQAGAGWPNRAMAV